MINLREFVKTNKFIVAAHRGASAVAPENTIPAFLKAISVGSDMIETDIHYTKDKQIIVHHNTILKSNKISIQDLNYTDIKGIDAGAWFSEEFKGTKIPKLSELLEIAKDKIYLNIEIKKPKTGEFAEFIDKLIGEINLYSNPEQVILASYYYDMLKYVKVKYPNINTAGIRIPHHTILPDVLKSEIDIDAYICSISGINRQISNSAASSDLFLGLYSVDTEKHLEKAIRYKATALGTNKPEDIIKYLNRKVNF